ncbi:MAG: ornithine carbamoyltransferase [Planctomycetota bacterium]
MRHVLSLETLTANEIRRVLELSVQMKSDLNQGLRPQSKAGHVMGLLFEKPSLRTRVSFETLIKQLGGDSLFLGEDVGWGKREPLRDFVPILTSYLDLLVIRAKSHEKVVEATQFSRCPIINGLTDVSHPCQALADILTVMEIAESLENVTIAYLGDGNNVAFSLAQICGKLGIGLRIGAPENYQLDSQVIQTINEDAGRELITQTADPKAAADGVQFVYTDVWTSMGQEAESKQRLGDLAGYQVNDDLMNVTDNATFLHCLPARRGEEVSDSVIDGPRSAIVQQANNRLHAQKGLVVWLLDEGQATSD